MKIDSSDWSPEIPKTIGLWEIRCMENNHQADRVAITNIGAHLFVHCEDVGRNPVRHYHDGLTDVTWRKLA